MESILVNINCCIDIYIGDRFSCNVCAVKVMLICFRNFSLLSFGEDAEEEEEINVTRSTEHKKKDTTSDTTSDKKKRLVGSRY